MPEVQLKNQFITGAAYVFVYDGAVIGMNRQNSSPPMALNGIILDEVSLYLAIPLLLVLPV